MVGYKRLMETPPDAATTRLLVLYGAAVVAVAARFMLGDAKITYHHRAVGRPGLAGRVWPPGAGVLHVELWRATQVDAGTLGIMNNVHVPAGLLVNLAIWQQQPHWPSFLLRQ